MKVDSPNGDLYEFMPMVMEPMEQALRTIEAHCEDKVGWDAKPMFMVLAGYPETGVVLASVELPNFVYVSPGDGLPLFVEILTNEDLKPMGDAIKAHLKASLPSLPLLGVLFIHEAWAVHANSKEELDKIDVMPSQHPDRIEIRGGVLVTVDGRLLVVERERGKEPRFQETDISTGCEVGGRLPDAMRRLVDIMETLSHDRTE